MVEDRLQIGSVTGVNPARRELRIAIAAGRNPEFEEMRWIRLELIEGESMRCRVRSVRLGQDEAIVFLVPGVTRDNVGRMKGSRVVIESAEQKPRDESYITDDVVGFTVRSADGTVLGEVAGFLQTKAHPVLEIERADGSTILVPAIEQVITRIDWDAATITTGELSGYAVEQDANDSSRQG